LTHVTHRRRFERLVAILSAVGILMSVMVVFAPAALAHHPEISARQVCDDGNVAIAYDSVSWRTDGLSGSAHNDIRIEVQVGGSGPWTQVGSGAYNAGNNYRFSGAFDASTYVGQSIVVRARAVGAWTNGQGGGETRQTSAIVVNLVCTETVTVSASPQACAVNQQGQPRGSVSFAIDPSSGATVQVYTNANFTGPVGGALGDGVALSLPPGTYYWRATAASGFELGGASTGSFTISPCQASVVVASGQCTVVQGVAQGSVQVTIDPTSGATVTVLDSGDDPVGTFTGSGGSQSLPPGSYSWTASAASGFAMAGPASGEFDIEPCTSSVSVAPSACQSVGGVGLGSATVGISPESGATVIISGPGGPHSFSGSGGSVSLAPGGYTWNATPGPGFSLTGPGSGSFEIDPCSAAVTVSGTCQLDGDSGSGVIEVTIDGSATVSIFDGATLVDSLTSSGTVSVAEGATYTWSAAAGSGFALQGPTEGEVAIEPCSRSLEIVVEGVCRNDVPYLTWTVTPVNFTATETTITWLDIDPSNPLYDSVQPLSGEMVWPGAVVGGGKAIDWPGWLFVDKVSKLPVPLGTEGGTWIKGADGFEATRPATSIQFTVNPTAVVDVDYPGGEPTCSGPPDEVLGEEIDNEDPDTLPFTGVNTEVLLGASLLMLGSGITLIQLARKREEG
jgi:hypothetical protein